MFLSPDLVASCAEMLFALLRNALSLGPCKTEVRSSSHGTCDGGRCLMESSLTFFQSRQVSSWPRYRDGPSLPLLDFAKWAAVNSKNVNM